MELFPKHHFCYNHDLNQHYSYYMIIIIKVIQSNDQY